MISTRIGFKVPTSFGTLENVVMLLQCTDFRIPLDMEESSCYGHTDVGAHSEHSFGVTKVAM
jgi:hypothetical protein